MKHLNAMYVALIGLTTAVSPLSAGIIISATHTTTAKLNEMQINKTYVDSDRMRYESQSKGVNTIVIFRQDKGLFWVINPDKTYMEITKQDMQAKMDEAKTQMDEQLKNVPEAQREMVKKMMAGRMPMAQPAGTIKTTYKKVAAGEKVNHWSCAKYEGYREDKKTKEVWTTDWKSFGLTPEAFKLMKDITEFFEGFAKDMAANFDKVGSEEWEKEQGYAGIPVKTLSYSDGQLRSTTEVKEVKQENLAASLFDLPPGLTKKDPFKQKPMR
jgi:hypothetical protein